MDDGLLDLSAIITFSYVGELKEVRCFSGKLGNSPRNYILGSSLIPHNRS